MHRTLLATVTAVMLAAPAWAQQDWSQAGRMDDRYAEGPRAGAGEGTPSASDWARAARIAERRVENRTVDALLEQADQALANRDWLLANAFTERAETTLLNRHAMPGRGTWRGAVQEADALRALNAADNAIARRDAEAARRAIRSAAATLGRVDMEDRAEARRMGSYAGYDRMRGEYGRDAGSPRGSSGFDTSYPSYAAGMGRATNPSAINPGTLLPEGAPGTTPLLEPLGGQQQRH
jgi:hypothetical protein